MITRPLRSSLLDHLPKDRIISRFEKAGGDEVSSGRLTSPESSAALAANSFGIFLDQPALLIFPPPTIISGSVTEVDLECEMRFPWSGGRHAWLDAEIKTDEILIGVESKRYEPFRDEKRVEFSDAYFRDVWGTEMKPFTQMRDGLATGSIVFSYLDAAQLVKHAFGLRTQGEKRKKIPHLLYLYPDSTIVRKTACHGAILGFVMGHDLRRLFVSR